MCSGSGGRSFQLNRVKQLPPTAVEGPCAAKFMLKALVGSGDTAGAAAQSMMDFNTGQHSLRMEPGRAVPVQLAGPWEWSEVGLPMSGCGAFLSEWSGLLPPPLPSRGTGGGCHSAVGPSHGEICQQFWSADTRHPQPLQLRECSLTREAVRRQAVP